MRTRYLVPIILLVLLLLPGCGGPPPGVLTPDQVTKAMVNQVVSVQGRITTAVQNPGGLGGTYLTLGDGHLTVRIQPDQWTAMSAAEQDRFRQGETVTVKGLVFQAGYQLVIVYGVNSPQTAATPQN